MKRLLFFFIGFILIPQAKAQLNLYPIEDPSFLYYLQNNYPEIIVNDSLDTDATAGIDTLDLPFMSSFTSIDGVQFFDDLTYLSCWGQNLTSLPELPDGLLRLSCFGNQLTSLPELPDGLIELQCFNNQLTSLPSLPEGLLILQVAGNMLTNLPQLPQGLPYINIMENPLLECVSNYLPQLPQLNDYPLCFGCIDEMACNYESDVVDSDESCIYAETYYNCNEECLFDSDGDGVCDELEIAGCIDESACNFDINATDANDSCLYAELYYNCDGICIIDTDGDGICDELEVSGCTDNTACNYAEIATDDDESCTYADMYYDCYGECINDFDIDGVCDELDNCIDESNADQLDDDSDGEGDACDYDDGIGIVELNEKLPLQIKIVDVLGREQQEHNKGSLLFYIYDNGKVEKKFNP